MQKPKYTEPTDFLFVSNITPYMLSLVPDNNALKVVYIQNPVHNYEPRPSDTFLEAQKDKSKTSTTTTKRPLVNPTEPTKRSKRQQTKTTTSTKMPPKDTDLTSFILTVPKKPRFHI